MSQNDELLRWMSKRPIDAQTAIAQFSCYRLAARIRELREDGHNIQTIMIRDGRSAYARYVLVQRKA
jgi:hypothetical protein